MMPGDTNKPKLSGIKLFRNTPVKLYGKYAMPQFLCTVGLVNVIGETYHTVYSFF
jgi:hypothetical protein